MGAERTSRSRRAMVLAVALGALMIVLGWSARPAHADLLGCGGLVPVGCNQQPACSDGVDNDGDAATDAADPGCASSTDGNEGDDVAPDAGGTSTVDVVPGTSGRQLGFNSSLGRWSRGSGITPDQEAALIAATGGTLQRTEISWGSVEQQPGVWRTDGLSAVDAAYDALNARGMGLLLLLGGTPGWASDWPSCGFLDWGCQAMHRDPPFSLAPRDPAGFGRFAGFVARRYQRAAIETWNEPNLRTGWTASSFPDPGRMAQMQCAAFDAVRAAGGLRPVLSPSFAWLEESFNDGQSVLQYLTTMYQRMGGRICWDRLALHLYAGKQYDGPNSKTARAFRVIRRVMARFHDTSPVWITETGQTTSGGQTGELNGFAQRSESEQRSLLRGMVNEFMSTPGVGAVILNTLRDRPWSGSDPGSAEYGLGLLRAQAVPRPAPKPAWCHFVAVAGNTYPGC